MSNSEQQYSIFSWAWWQGNTQQDNANNEEENAYKTSTTSATSSTPSTTTTMSKNEKVTKVRGATYTFPESYLLHGGSSSSISEIGDDTSHTAASASASASVVVLDMTDTQAIVDEEKLRQQIGEIERKFALANEIDSTNAHNSSRRSSSASASGDFNVVNNNNNSSRRSRSRSRSWVNRRSSSSSSSKSSSRRSSAASDSHANSRSRRSSSGSGTSINAMGRSMQRNAVENAALSGSVRRSSPPLSNRGRSRSRSRSAASSHHRLTSPMESSLKPVTNNFGDSDNVDSASPGSAPSRNSVGAGGTAFWSRNTSGNMCMGDDYGIAASKMEKFEQLLQESDIDLEQLRKLSWSGIPAAFRGTVWKLLLGYLPCNRSRREHTLARKRKEYLEFVSKYYNEKAMKKTEYENAVQRQIHIDVPRTNPDVSLFQHQQIQDALERILYIWSIRHPASGYVQGLNDIVTPFIIVFLYDFIGGDVFNMRMDMISEEVLTNVECDSFWCFSTFLDFVQDHYTINQPGIQRMVAKLEEIIRKIDERLYNHIHSHNLMFIQFAFRWMNCLLMREISLKLVVRMFDAFIAEGDNFEALHVFVCASFLKTWSEKLQTLDDSEMIIFLQQLPTHDWTYKEIEMLLSQAYMLKMLYS